MPMSVLAGTNVPSGKTVSLMQCVAINGTGGYRRNPSRMLASSNCVQRYAFELHHIENDGNNVLILVSFRLIDCRSRTKTTAFNGISDKTQNDLVDHLHIFPNLALVANIEPTEEFPVPYGQLEALCNKM
ncbi:hypothetical protein PsorP6_002766 [Peronosclerospora sorghi]|uniref:Uncharacterized protein n=1 Tax=Peronosclerospora sorghi TaxID=230839 RepID=A0ACC0VPD3_9STRA|nr:hypothetical protein PsorP6_002766 [Peronosclerospora sorghi]